jgi:hypothetical protein
LGGMVEFLRGGGAEHGLKGFSGVGSECLKAGAVAGAALRADEGKSGEFHDRFSLEQLLASSL